MRCSNYRLHIKLWLKKCLIGNLYSGIKFQMRTVSNNMKTKISPAPILSSVEQSSQAWNNIEHSQKCYKSSSVPCRTYPQKSCICIQNLLTVMNCPRKRQKNPLSWGWYKKSPRYSRLYIAPIETQNVRFFKPLCAFFPVGNPNKLLIIANILLKLRLMWNWRDYTDLVHKQLSCTQEMYIL